MNSPDKKPAGVREEPTITVSNLRLASQRRRPNTVAAWADLTITGKTGVERRWMGARLLFRNDWYCLMVDGQISPSTYIRGSCLIPPCWQKDAFWAVFDACCKMEQEEDQRQAAEIAAGLRFAPLPLDMITPKE